MKMTNRLLTIFGCFAAIACLLVYTGNVIAEGTKAAANKGGWTSPVPDPLVFVQYTEARERAFSLLIPKGWKAEGGIFYVDPTAAGGSLNATAPKVNFSVKKDNAGTVMLQWLPDFYYADMRYSPAGQMGLFPPGSRYNGAMVSVCPPAKDFLLKFAFPQARPLAQNVQVIEVKPMPQVARLYAQASAIPGIQYDAATVTVTYVENGIRLREQMFTAVENLGQAGAGLWQNKQTVFARAPVNEFKAWNKIGSMIYYSVQINPQWLLAVIQATQQRNQIAADTQRTIQQLDADIVAHRQKVNEDMRRDGYLTLTGQEEYLNPYTGKSEIRPDGWKYHWQNAAGEVVVSNVDGYSPNHDPNINRGDFKKSTVKAR